MHSTQISSLTTFLANCINAAAEDDKFFCFITPIPKVLTTQGDVGIIFILASLPFKNISGKRLIPRLFSTMEIIVFSSLHENFILGFIFATSKAVLTSLSMPLEDAIKGYSKKAEKGNVLL